MLSNILSVRNPALPPRAEIALLSLEFRAAVNEAAIAEPDDEARQQLREQLGLLMQERRESLGLEVAQAQADATAAIAAAQRAASVIVAHASAVNVPMPPADTVAPVIWAAPTASQEMGPPVEHVVMPVESAVQIVDPPVERMIKQVITPNAQTAAVLMRTGEEPTPSAEVPAGPAFTVDVHRQPVLAKPTSTVVIDAETFATVFATVVAALLNERFAGWDPRMMGSGTPVPIPVKPSFWTHARHPDVILMSLTMVIVLVILAAWMA